MLLQTDQHTDHGPPSFIKYIVAGDTRRRVLFCVGTAGKCYTSSAVTCGVGVTCVRSRTAVGGQMVVVFITGRSCGPETVRVKVLVVRLTFLYT